jgi:hypothetical protein
MMGCAPDEKTCNGACVKISDPLYGCGATSCDACATPQHAAAACENGVCVLGTCEMGFMNCDGNEANGCETNVSNDPTQCGACGSPCSVPNATANCTNGKCGVATCNAGFQDCDGDPTNGCEAKPDADPKNCGMCNKPCLQGQGCQGGMCGVFCAKGKADCNNPNPGTPDADGCETPLGTATDCNFCGDVCAPANSQSHCDGQTGTCILDQCNPGFMNCDSQFANGCETNVNTDAANCGNCGNVCQGGPHATPVCTSGGCAINCDPGYNNCNSPNPQTADADGCETHSDVDTSNCGSCGHACNVPNATPACAGGMCLIGQCNTGFQDCDMQPANGCEINTNNDPNNCGGCGIKCTIANGTAACVNGMCAVGTCNVGFQDCDGQVSNGCETSTGTDVNNCGMCGKVCNLPNATSTCTNGACQVAACNAGFQNCDNQPNNGCEVNTTNDALNCGGCNHQCFVANGTPGCANSNCTVAGCNMGWGDCNGQAGDGCEVNLTTNLSNCGSCGNNCQTKCTANVTATTCNSGTCQILACTGGHYDIDGTCTDGCECTTSGTSAACLSPSSLGALQVGQTQTFSGNLVPAGQEAYLTITFNGNTNYSYHPHVTMTAGSSEFFFDVLVNCAGAAIACGTEGGNSVNVTDWETSYTGGDPSQPANFQAIPPVGTNGTVIIHVKRRPGKPVSCNNYTLTISN